MPTPKQKDPIAYDALVHIRDKYQALDLPAPPDVALFLGVFDGDKSVVEEAMARNANPRISLGSVFRRHFRALDDFRAFGAELESTTTRATETIQHLAESFTPPGLTKGS